MPRSTGPRGASTLNSSARAYATRGLLLPTRSPASSAAPWRPIIAAILFPIGGATLISVYIAVLCALSILCYFLAEETFQKDIYAGRPRRTAPARRATGMRSTESYPYELHPPRGGRGRHVHRPRGPLGGNPDHGQGPLDPAGPVRGRDERYRDLRRGALSRARPRPRHDRGDQRPAGAPRRPHGPRHHGRLQGRAGDSPPEPSRPLRPDPRPPATPHTTRTALHGRRKDGP